MFEGKRRPLTDDGLAHAVMPPDRCQGLSVRAAQMYLTFLGYRPGAVHGWFGTITPRKRGAAVFSRRKGWPSLAAGWMRRHSRVLARAVRKRLVRPSQKSRVGERSFA